jgi:8-oxo-dGTP pyrophosphatase MutT (NUDIX family)
MKRAVVALIYGPENKVLMGRRKDTGKWTFVAGCCELGEDPRNAIIREVREESGLDAQDTKLVMVEINPNALVYLFEVKATGNIDTSKDPDQEFDGTLTWEDPFDWVMELQIPAPNNVALKYLASKK